MKRSGGFTLIELMVVIGIMILLATIVATGSFGMSRASGYMAAENVVYNTLQAARQKACTDGKRVVVAFVKIEADANTESDDYALVTVEAAGTIEKMSKKDRTIFYDRTSVLANFLRERSDDAIWNLDTAVCVEGPFTNSVEDLEVWTDQAIPYKDYESESSGSESANEEKVGYFGDSPVKVKLLGKDSFSTRDWDEGHAYGFQVGETQELPLGFKLRVDGKTSNLEKTPITFEPDGGSSDCTLEIFEEINAVAGNTAGKVVITVNNGTIKVKRE
jgi:type II secretory pathway pseudopilin PulG